MATPTTPNASFDVRSGHGPASTIPEEIKRWSWGAFLLTFIWGIGNRVWMSLLVFVPIANVVAPFILGAKGNELAWREKQWASVEAFHKTQRKWAMAGLIVLGVSILLSIGSVILVLKFGKPVQSPSDSSMSALENVSDSEFMEESEPGVWITYSSPAGDFEVSFPSEPNSESNSYTGENDETVYTTVLQADEGTAGYLVAIEEFPELFPSTDTESMTIDHLRASLRRVEQSIEGASVTSTETMSSMGLPALQYVMTFESGRVEEGTMVLKGKKVYTVFAEYIADQKPEAYDSFQSSFKLK